MQYEKKKKHVKKSTRSCSQLYNNHMKKLYIYIFTVYTKKYQAYKEEIQGGKKGTPTTCNIQKYLNVMPLV